MVLRCPFLNLVLKKIWIFFLRKINTYGNYLAVQTLINYTYK